MKSYLLMNSEASMIAAKMFFQIREGTSPLTSSTSLYTIHTSIFIASYY